MRAISPLIFALLVPVMATAGGPLLPGFCDDVIPPPPDALEPNDGMLTATPISPDNTLPLLQSLHTDDDEDWFFFHGYPFALTGDVYTLRVLPPAGGTPPGTFMNFDPPLRGPGLFFRFFSSDGTQFNILDPIEQGCVDPGVGNFFEYDLTLPAEDDYFLQITQCRNEGLDVNADMQDDKGQYCIPDNAGYQLQIFQPVGAQTGQLAGTIIDSVTGAAVGSAVLGTGSVAFTTYSNPATGQFQSAVTIVNAGTATIAARGYQAQSVQFDIVEGQTTPCDVTLSPEGSGSPDLQVNGPLVMPVLADAGGQITLSANARNLGDAAASASMLRFYLSTDGNITSADTEVGAMPVAGLPAGSQSGQMITASSPSSAGTFFAGACIDSVTGESDTGNNCFGAAPLIVADDRIFASGFEATAAKAVPTVTGDTHKGNPAACVLL